MPSKSAAQHRLMEAVAHSAKFAKKVGIPQSVGKDFSAADKAKGTYMKDHGTKHMTHKMMPGQHRKHLNHGAIVDGFRAMGGPVGDYSASSKTGLPAGMDMGAAKKHQGMDMKATMEGNEHYLFPKR